MRLIDADALMQTLGITDMDCEKCEWGEYNHCIRGGDFEDACSAIEDAPTIELERKMGRWIFIRPTKEDRPYVACDQCGQVEAWDENCGMLCALLGEKYAHYCPNCGAYMGQREE